MIKSSADATTNAVGEALCGAKALHQSGREAASEGFVKNFDRIIVRIVAGGPKPDHVNAALVHVLFLHLVIAGLGGFKLDFRRFCSRAFGPIAKSATQLSFHLGGIEVARKSENDVVGMDVCLVPIEQVLPCDRRNGRVFGYPRIWIAGAIRQPRGFAYGNLADVVVAARDTIENFVLGEVELFRAELRFTHQFDEHLEDIVKVFF